MLRLPPLASERCVQRMQVRHECGRAAAPATASKAASTAIRGSPWSVVVAARRMASTMITKPAISPAMPKPRLGTSSVTIHQPPPTATARPTSAITSSTALFSRNTRTATSRSRYAPRARIASTRCRTVVAARLPCARSLFGVSSPCGSSHRRCPLPNLHPPRTDRTHPDRVIQPARALARAAETGYRCLLAGLTHPDSVVHSLSALVAGPSPGRRSRVFGQVLDSLVCGDGRLIRHPGGPALRFRRTTDAPCRAGLAALVGVEARHAVGGHSHDRSVCCDSVRRSTRCGGCQRMGDGAAVSVQARRNLNTWRARDDHRLRHRTSRGCE